jgi:hypothetical protein
LSAGPGKSDPFREWVISLRSAAARARATTGAGATARAASGAGAGARAKQNKNKNKNKLAPDNMQNTEQRSQQNGTHIHAPFLVHDIRVATQDYGVNHDYFKSCVKISR